MIESVQELPITLASNTATIAFSVDDIRTRSANCCNGWLSHSQGSPLYQLLNCGYYEISFNGDASSTTAGNVSIGLYRDGILVPGTAASSTLAAAGDIENLKFKKVIHVCGRASTTITVGSVPTVSDFTDITAPGLDTETPIISNANFIIKKIA